MFRKLAVFAAFLLLAAAALAGPSVSRHAFAVDIVGREPVSPATSFSRDVETIYFFTQLHDIGDPTEVRHLWSYGGQVLAEVSLHVEGIAWRTWSSKKIMPGQLGEWTVEVEDVDGNILFTSSFLVTE